MPIVTFTTDFGVGDGYAGAMKGVVLSLAPAAQLVDVTHGVPPMDVAAGAVALAQAASLFRRDPVSPTFHGRDVFAPTAGRLASGAVAADVGPSIDAIVELGAPPLHKQGGVVEGQAIHVDSFGNLITSLPAELFAGSGATGAAEVQVEVEGAEGRFRPVFGRTFSDVQSGALIAYIGSGGQLEIARRDGSAAARMGAGRGTPVRVTLTT